MAKKIKTLALITFILSGAVHALPETKEVKCHVSLLGGAETIYFGVLPKQPLKKIADSLVGRNILTTLSKDKMNIYKVYECALAKESFKSSKARNIEVELAL